MSELNYKSDIVEVYVKSDIITLNITNSVNAGGGGASALDDLTDVSITTPASGAFLRYDGAQWIDNTIQAGDIPSHTHAISDVTNLQTTLDGKVDENAPITGATKTKVTFDAKGLVTAGADANLDDLGDVVLTSPSNNQMLRYLPTSGGWVNQTQFFFAGSSGTDFNIVVSGATGSHTFNIPSASAANRGLVTTGAQTLAGDKTFSGSVAVQGDLSVTNMPNATKSEVVYFDTTTKKLSYGSITAGASALDDLTDVAITSPANNEVLKYNGTSWVNASAPAGASDLDGLTDVTITTPQEGQVLSYNGSNWENKQVSFAAIHLFNYYNFI